MTKYLHIRFLQFTFFGLLLLGRQLPSFAATGLSNQNIDNGVSPLEVKATLSQSKRLQTFDVGSLNLENAILSVNSVEQIASAISISLIDFNNITANGYSWLLFKNSNTNLSMNIGTVNNSSPQTWTLPANLFTYASISGRSDFINPNTIPLGLQISGANKAMRTLYFDNNNRPMKVYDHYNISTRIINHLGTSYDLEVGTNQTFDEPDYEVTDIPLALNDSITSTIEEKDYITNLALNKFVENSIVDAFGTIITPDGKFDCLRLSMVKQKYTRPDESTAYTLSSTTNEVSFMTREGVYFNAKVSATSGTVILNNFQYRKVVQTALLTESRDIKLSNDSKGVTINIDNAIAHPSAILDIKNDSLGILIPRIAKVNRPKSPATGLLVYQIDSPSLGSPSGFYYFDGTAWQRMNNTVSSARIASNSSDVQSGIGQIANGTTFIKFESPQENPENLIISIQAEGDCNGLYISEKTKYGFWVKELQKGKSNVKFSYSSSKN